MNGIGTNLQFLRTRSGMTQEQLAERLEVSRQTVSKWESDAAWPEMNKLLQLCELFGVSLDTLTRGDAQKETAADTAGYDAAQNRFAAVTAGSVAVMLLGLTLAAVLVNCWPDQPAGLPGILFLLCLTLGAVPLVVAAQQREIFCKKHPQIAPFYTQRQRDAFETRYPIYLGAGVGCMLVGLVLAALFTMTLPGCRWLAGPVFLGLVNVGGPLIVWAGLQKEKYDIEAYNRDNCPSEEKREKLRRTGAACALLVLLAMAVFFTLGMVWGLWQYAGAVFAVCTILCAGAAVFINLWKK